MRTLRVETKHIPFAIAAMLALMGVTVAQRSNHNLSSQKNIQAEVGSSENAEEAKVTINGKQVDLGADGQGTFDTGNGTVQVQSNKTTTSSGGTRTVITNEDGTVDIRVESNSSSNSGESQIRFRDRSSVEIEQDSSIQIKQKGEGNVSVSN